MNNSIFQSTGLTGTSWTNIGATDNTGHTTVIEATPPGTAPTIGLVGIQGAPNGSPVPSAITAPLGPTTTPATAVAVTDTGTPPSGTTIGTGAQGLIGWLGTLSLQIANGSDAANNSKTATATNVTPADCSGTATTSVANIIGLGTANIHGFTIKNEDTTISLCMSLTATAVCAAAGSYTLVGYSQAGPNSFTTPPGLGSNHTVSIKSASATAVYTCTSW
jgi:hypothetical protein